MRSGLNLPLVLARDELSCRQRDEMFRLLGEHFLGVSRDRFEQDLADKNWVIVITRASRNPAKRESERDVTTPRLCSEIRLAMTGRA